MDKTETIRIRVTPKDKAILARVAKAADRPTLSDWARRILLAAAEKKGDHQ